MDLKKKLKYDIYKGTEQEMKDSGGELNLVKCTYTQVKEFCKRLSVNFDKLMDGDYIAVGKSGFWLEEAM